MVFGVTGCHLGEKNDTPAIQSAPADTLSESGDTLRADTPITKSDTLHILVVPIANGYTYAMHGYDFNPIIRTELNKLEGMSVGPFPYKKMKGSGFQGVFDKRYCASIIQNTTAEFLVMTRFIGGEVMLGNATSWGYETKILHTGSLVQENSIHAENLDSYAAIEKHIKAHIGELKADLENLK